MISEIEVPEGWRVKRLGDFVRIVMGQSPPSSTYNVQSEGMAFFQGNSDFGSKFPSVRLFTSKPTKKAYKNNILMSVRAPVGALNICNRECCIGRGLCSIDSIEGGNKFLFYLLKFKNNDLIKISTGSTFSGINKNALSNLKIVLPPFEEQQKIADILSKVDEQIGLTERMIDKTEELKKGLMRKLLTKGIKHNIFTKIIIGTKTYEIPSEWDIKTAKETLYMKGRIGWKGLKKSEFTKEGPFLITGVHFKEGKIDWENCFHIPMSRYVESPEIQIKNNDVLVTKDGTIGKVAYVDDLSGMASLNSHLLVLRPLSNDELFPRYLYYVLRSNLFKNHVNSIKTGSTLAGLSQSNFGKFKYFVPKLDEQKQITSILSKVDEQIQDNKKELNNLQELKKGLMQDLLTGKVRVSV